MFAIRTTSIRILPLLLGGLLMSHASEAHASLSAQDHFIDPAFLDDEAVQEINKFLKEKHELNKHLQLGEAMNLTSANLHNAQNDIWVDAFGQAAFPGFSTDYTGLISNPLAPEQIFAVNNGAVVGQALINSVALFPLGEIASPQLPQGVLQHHVASFVIGDSTETLGLIFETNINTVPELNLTEPVGNGFGFQPWIAIPDGPLSGSDIAFVLHLYFSGHIPDADTLGSIVADLGSPAPMMDVNIMQEPLGGQFGSGAGGLLVGTDCDQIAEELIACANEEIQTLKAAFQEATAKMKEKLVDAQNAANAAMDEAGKKVKDGAIEGAAWGCGTGIAGAGLLALAGPPGWVLGGVVVLASTLGGGLGAGNGADNALTDIHVTQDALATVKAAQCEVADAAKNSGVHGDGGYVDGLNDCGENIPEECPEVKDLFDALKADVDDLVEDVAELVCEGC